MPKRKRNNHNFYKKVSKNTSICLELANEYNNDLSSDSERNSHKSNTLNSISEERTCNVEHCQNDKSLHSGYVNDDIFNEISTDTDSVSVDENILTTNNGAENRFLIGLRSLVVTCGIPNNTTRKLLLLLKTVPGLTDLPSDPRALLATPRQTISKVVKPGLYSHIGIANAVRKLCSISGNIFNKIELLVNIDGLPLSKSSGSQIYPILCSLVEFPNNVTVIGIYHGHEKPCSSNEFLSDFTEEAIHLTNNGFIYNGHNIPFKIFGFICDAPAKSLITYCKGHTGFYSCTKCMQKGKYIKGRVSLTMLNAPKRTNENFIRRLQLEHHTGKSILENIPGLGMVDRFPLEYMHLVCLGVVKKLLVSMWLFGQPLNKLSTESISKISDILISLKSHIPCEFVRKTRSLNEVKRWKATELRFFLLYSGPFILKTNLSSDKYLHFMTLHVAIRILLDEAHRKKYSDYSHSLLVYFVTQFKAIYGVQYISHNVHGLLHIVEDTKLFGNLDSYSAFPFENYLQILKNLVRKGHAPLAQIIRRLHEIDSLSQAPSKKQTEIELINEHIEGPLPAGNFTIQYKKIKIQNFSFSTDVANCGCYLKDKSVVVIENIAKKGDEYYLIGRKFLNVQNFFDTPCQSSLLNIYTVHTLDRTISAWSINEIFCKLVMFPNNDSFIVFPVIHTSDFCKPD